MTTTLTRRGFLRLSATAAAAVAMGWSMRREAAAFANAYWGVWAEPRAGETVLQALTNLEARVGRRFGVQRNYVADMKRDLLSRQVTWLSDRGTIPYRGFHSDVAWSSVAAGAKDAWIEKQAEALARWGQPIYLAFTPEPERRTLGTPQDFVAAYHRILATFERVGAANVTWVLALMAGTYDGGQGGHRVWMPEGIDAIGADGYNRSPSVPGNWRSFAEIFTPAHDVATAMGRKLFIGEVGCVEDPGRPDAKARWLYDLGTTVGHWPETVAVCYSNVDAIYGGVSLGYRVDSSSQSLAAYRDVGLSSDFVS